MSPRIPAVVPSSRTRASSIKDFKVIKPISKGAFGSVYLAKKITTGDYYAIKVLKKSDMVAKNQVTNVKAERMILMTQTDSEFVVKLFYTFQSKDYLYLVMEYLPGGDCAALVKNLGGLPEDWAKRYIAEVIVGLNHLHGAGIIHRDLKPDNLLIDSKGHLKLTDFGLSRIGLLGRQTQLPTAETPQQHFVGTPDYLAPESILGVGMDAGVDWWALGVIAYEFLYGIPPFHDETPEKVFENILSRKLEWHEDLIEISPEARDFIDRLLVSDSSRRLGVKGAEEVKSHPFLDGVDWDNLLLQPVDFVPQVNDPESTDYFDPR
ncbi:Pkinase-domain-containing protein, partial [Rhodotorula sp. JG-1b]